jgi:hypothetical protein
VSIEAIVVALAEVRDATLAAHQHIEAARTRLAEAVAILVELNRNHPESLLPPQFRQADAGLADGLEFIAGGLAAIDQFQAGL